jgi:hypothetical protein
MPTTLYTVRFSITQQEKAQLRQLSEATGINVVKLCRIIVAAVLNPTIQAALKQVPPMDKLAWTTLADLFAPMGPEESQPKQGPENRTTTNQLHSALAGITNANLSVD